MVVVPVSDWFDIGSLLNLAGIKIICKQAVPFYQKNRRLVGDAVENTVESVDVGLFQTEVAEGAKGSVAIRCFKAFLGFEYVVGGFLDNRFGGETSGLGDVEICVFGFWFTAAGFGWHVFSEEIGYLAVLANADCDGDFVAVVAIEFDDVFWEAGLVHCIEDLVVGDFHLVNRDTRIR